MDAHRTTHKTSLPVSLSVAFILLLLLLPVRQPAYADIGPQPTLAFTWDLSAWEYAPVIEQVNLYECGDDPTCSEPELVEELAAQRMTCDETGCFAMVYNGGGYWQLEMDVNGATLISAPFEKGSYDSDHTVIIYADRLDIVTIEPPPAAVDFEPERSFGSNMLTVTLISLTLAFVATLIIELIIAWVYLARKKLPRRLLALTLLGNLITVPLLWLLFPFFNLGVVIMILLQFSTAFVLETLVYRLFGGNSFRWKRSIALAWWTNLGSELLGLAFILFLRFIA